jgi:O-antigen ligase
VAAVLSGVAVLAAGQQPTATTTRLALAVAIGVCGLVVASIVAITNFRWLILGALVVRISLDGLKGTGTLDPGVALGAAFTLLTAYNLYRRAVTRRLHPIHPLIIALSGFAGCTLLSAALSTHKEVAFIGSSKVFAGVAMLAAIQQELVDDPRFARRVLGAVLASAPLPFVIATFQFLTNNGNHQTNGFNRVFGTAVHPTAFASYLLLVMVAAVTLYFTTKTHRWIPALVIGWATFLVVFTYTRAAWATAAIGVVYLMLRTDRRYLIPLAMAGTLVWISVPQIQARLADLTQAQAVSGGRPANSLDWRRQYWAQVLPLAHGHEAVGIGLGTTAESNLQNAEPHDILIQSYVETGWLGSTGLAIVAATFMGTVYRRGRSARTSAERLYSVSMGAAGLMLLGESLASNVLTQTMLFWYGAATICLGYRAEPEAALTEPQGAVTQCVQTRTPVRTRPATAAYRRA